MFKDIVKVRERVNISSKFSTNDLISVKHSLLLPYSN